MSTILVSKEEQREILKNLSMNHRDDFVSALHEFKSKLGADHEHHDKIGEVALPLNDFARALKPHYKHHLIQKTIQEHTADKHLVHLDNI
jgi:hypothetical protein